MFPGLPPSYDESSFPGELVHLECSLVKGWSTEETIRFPCLYIRQPAHVATIFYCHGNYSDLGYDYPFLKQLSRMTQCNIVAMEYAGYGTATGKPNEASSYAIVDKCIEFIQSTRESNIYIMGYSIGTGSACYAAEKLRGMGISIKGLILIAPYSSIRDLAWDTVGPFALLVPQQFNNAERVSKLDCSIYVFHGEDDEVIPAYHSVKIIRSCGHQNKLLKIHERKGHGIDLAWLKRMCEHVFEKNF